MEYLQLLISLRNSYTTTAPCSFDPDRYHMLTPTPLSLSTLPTLSPLSLSTLPTLSPLSPHTLPTLSPLSPNSLSPLSQFSPLSPTLSYSLPLSLLSGARVSHRVVVEVTVVVQRMLWWVLVLHNIA